MRSDAADTSVPPVLAGAVARLLLPTVLSALGLLALVGAAVVGLSAL